MADPSKPMAMGTWRILWEALELPKKNRGLMLPIILLTLLSSSLLFLSDYFSTNSLIVDLVINSFAMISTAPNTPEYAKDLAAVRKDRTELTILEAIFSTVSFIVNSFLLIATVNAAAATYLARHLTLKELLARVKKSWKGPVITQVYVNVLFFGFRLLLLPLIGFFVVFVVLSKGSATLIAFGVALTLVALYLYLRLAVGWEVGLVVSVLEDGCYWIGAVTRATELIKGRRCQGMCITLTSIVLIAAISVADYILTASPLASGFVMVIVTGLWNVVILGAYTVFYYDCKKSQGEEVGISMEGGQFLYSSLPTSAQVDAVLP